MTSAVGRARRGVSFGGDRMTRPHPSHRVGLLQPSLLTSHLSLGSWLGACLAARSPAPKGAAPFLIPTSDPPQNMQIAWPERPLPSAWGAGWGVGSEGRMTSCVGVSWERGKTGGMEPGTDAGKPGGRFWCRAGCPRPVETRHRSDRAEQEPGPWAGTDHHTHQDSCPAPCPTCPQTLTVGMSSHPQGGAAGAGQPGRVGRVGMGGRVPGQLAALQGGSPGDHEMGGQVPGTAA